MYGNESETETNGWIVGAVELAVQLTDGIFFFSTAPHNEVQLIAVKTARAA